MKVKLVEQPGIQTRAIIKNQEAEIRRLSEEVSNY
jgi:hypothetical protein